MWRIGIKSVSTPTCCNSFHLPSCIEAGPFFCLEGYEESYFLDFQPFLLADVGPRQLTRSLMNRLCNINAIEWTPTFTILLPVTPTCHLGWPVERGAG